MSEKPDEVKVYLKITGFECSPKEISDLLSIKATRTWLRGDDIYPRTIVKRKENGWLLQSKIAPDIRVIKHIENLLAITLPKKNHFEKLPEGTDVAIYCVVYSEFGRPDISLKPDMVKAIASLGAALDFDLYTLGDGK